MTKEWLFQRVASNVGVAIQTCRFFGNAISSRPIWDPFQTATANRAAAMTEARMGRLPRIRPKQAAPNAATAAATNVSDVTLNRPESSSGTTATQAAAAPARSQA